MWHLRTPLTGGLGSTGAVLGSVILEGFSNQPLAPLLPVQVCLLGLVGLAEGIQAVHLVGFGFLEAPDGSAARSWLCQGSSDSRRKIQVKRDGTQLPFGEVVCPNAHCVPQLLPH